MVDGLRSGDVWVARARRETAAAGGTRALVVAEGPDARPRGSDRRRRRVAPWEDGQGRWWLCVALIVALAFAVRVVHMLQDGGLDDVHFYDDGVYYAAADALIHGRMPYQAFLFVEAPGVAVAAVPFAVLGAVFGDPVGFAAGNLAFAAVGAASAGLVVVTLRRFGLPAALVGGFCYAVTNVIVDAERSIRLEPVATLLLLASLVLLAAPRDRHGTRRAVTAGILLGLTLGFKIWYVVPAGIILLAFRGRRVLVASGAACGALALYLPFFAPAPRAMFRQVVLDQLGRPRMDVSVGARLHSILGDLQLPAWPGSAGNGQAAAGLHGVTALAAVLAVAAVATVFTVRTARIYAILLLADTAVLLLSPSFLTYYPSLTMFALALVAGVAFGRWIALLRRRGLRIGVTAATLLAVTAVDLPIQHASVPEPPIARLRAAAAKVDGCVVSDDNAILAAMNVLSRDLARGCALWPDVTGWTYDAYGDKVDGVEVPWVADPVWQEHVVGYLTSGAAVVQYLSGTGLDTRSESLLHQGRVLVSAGRWSLYATPDHIPPAPTTPAALAAEARKSG